jgi:isopenicillin-N epimerase
VAEALEFHHAIGTDRKAARLRLLKDRWARRFERHPRASVLTSFDPAQACAIGFISVRDVDPQAIVLHLWAKHRIFVTPIKHAEFHGIRVTPNVYTTLSEIDTFAAALERVVDEGIDD